jgi:hypothetical protein
MRAPLAKTVAALAMLLAATLAAPPPASAHLVQTGFGEFYDGIGHLLATLPDLFIVVAVALLAGSSGAPAARRALIALPAAWLAAGLLGSIAAVDIVSPWVTTLLFGLVGVLVALDLKLSPRLVLTLSLVAGALHGWSNGASIVEALRELEPTAATSGSLALSGIATAVFAIVTIVSAVVVPIESYAARVAVRVAGSWLTAIAILMVGWLVRARGSV